MKHIAFFKVGLGLLLCVICAQLPAQIPVPPPAAAAPLRSPAELDQLLGPIALYPDPLIAEILPAATLPSEVVLADRYVRGGGDPNQIDAQPWDPSVKALARYPTVLAWMDDNIAWTTDVGQAFLNQQGDVMNAIQRLRSQALSLGNLQSTQQQTVVNDNGLIEVVPANPEVVYVPAYQPQQVYYEAPPSPGFFVSFGLALPIGIWFNHDFDWHNHRVIVWHHDQPRPHDWWVHPGFSRPEIVNQVNVWHPRVRPPLGLPEHGDRGWAHQPVVVSRPVPPRIEHPAPPRVERPAPVVPRPEQRPGFYSGAHPPSGALIGVQSAPQTRVYSARGQESRQTIVSLPAAPAPHASAPAPSHAAPERNRR